jgi:hypothetical protein
MIESEYDSANSADPCGQEPRFPNRREPAASAIRLRTSCATTYPRYIQAQRLHIYRASILQNSTPETNRMALSLSLTPVSPALFTEVALTNLFALSLDLINTLPSRSLPPPAPATAITWSAGKRDGETKLWKATYEKEPWIARITEVSDISYDALSRGLVTEKSATEKAALMGEGDKIENVGEKRVLGDVTTYGNGEIGA